MKKSVLSIFLLFVALSLSATRRYVSLNGDDMLSALTPQTAHSTIQVTIDNSKPGDTVIITTGVYHEGFTVKDGVNVIGEKGVVLDGSSMGSRLINTEQDCLLPTLIENLTLQNACHNQLAGGVLLKGTITMRNCIVRACSGMQVGGILITGEANEGSAKSAVVENCLVYNCSATGHCWPDAGGIANFNGIVRHTTICNNYGDRYGGIHSESTVEHCVMWGNQSEEGFVDPANYVSDEGFSCEYTNFANDGFEEHFFIQPWLSDDNLAEGGPHFRFPTAFAGVPKSRAEKETVLNADYSVYPDSPFFNHAGADFNMPHKSVVTDIRVLTDTLRVHVNGTTLLHAIVSPSDADDKRLIYAVKDTAVALAVNNNIMGRKEGITSVIVKTFDGTIEKQVVVLVTPQPIIIVHKAVQQADSLYKAEDYTVPSYIPFLVAKETARTDSSEQNLLSLQQKINQLKPKETPYCMVANINGDPRTRMAFCWFTNEGITDGVVQLIAKKNATEADFIGADEISANTVTTLPLHYAISTSGLIRAAHIDKHTAFRYVSHKALAENLKPGTHYSWRVGTEGHWSDIAHFQTADKKQKDFSFIYMTDSHIQNQEYIDAARLCADAVAQNEQNARFCVFPGDFVDTGTKYNSEWEWERWFEEALKPVIMQMPIVPTDGNHDDSPLLNYTYHFNTDSTFNSMATVKPQFSGITYSFVYGDLLLMVYSMQDFWLGDYNYDALTSTYFTEDLGNWFRAQVKAHPNCKHRVALVHKNLFSGSDHQRDKETPLMRETLLPVFKECEIDLVLQGHDHTYEVIGPVNPDSRRPILTAITNLQEVETDPVKNITGKKNGTYDVSEGTLYFIGATCGAKRYTPLTREEMDASYDIHHLHNYFDLFTGMFGQPGAPSYTRVTVSKKQLLMESFKVNENGTTTLFNTLKIVRSKKHKKL